MSDEKFIQGVQRELAHRKKELTSIRFGLPAGDPYPSQNESWVTRAAVVLAYAHWEGFVKSSGRRYIDLVNRSGTRASELKLGFQALTLMSHFKRSSGSSKGKYLSEILEQMDTARAQPFHVNSDKAFDTEGNLSSSVFADLIASLGLAPASSFTMRIGFIDATLMYSRNQVAHGELVAFTQDEAIQRIDGVMVLLETFSEQIIQASIDGAYLAGQVLGD